MITILQFNLQSNVKLTASWETKFQFSYFKVNVFEARVRLVAKYRNKLFKLFFCFFFQTIGKIAKTNDFVSTFVENKI